jgi:hypothetical protein
MRGRLDGEGTYCQKSCGGRVKSGGKTSEGPSVKGHVGKLRRFGDLMSRNMCELVDSGGIYCPWTTLEGR